MNELSVISERSNFPEKFQERFLIKRFQDTPIEIDLKQYLVLFEAMKAGEKFIKIRKHLIMLNGIKSVDPLWGEENIPPRPKAIYMYNGAKVDYPMDEKGATNQDEIDEWNKYFGKEDE